MPRTAQLDPTTTRVVAPNPSHMTLDGTNTYVLSEPGSGSAVVVDPGPLDATHLDAVEAVLAQRDAACALVAVTHHHLDHAAAARSWAALWGCRVAAARRDVAGAQGLLVTNDQVLDVGWKLEAVATPGHVDDHLAFRLAHGPLLTGDHVLGRGTSVIAHPEGDLAAYLESLRRVLALGPDALYPGHGPELSEDPSGVVRFYLEHRAFRERQIVLLLADGPGTPRGLVERIYADVDPVLWSAAERSTRAALDKLVADGAVRAVEGESYALSDPPT